LAPRREPQEPLARVLIVDGKLSRASLRAQLVQQGIHRVRLEEAALDVQDHVVAVRLVETDGWSLAHARLDDREFHLVAIPVGVGGREDRPELEVAEPADTLEAVAHLLLLEAQLSGIGEVLQTAAAAPAEVGAGRVDPIGGRRLDRFDHSTPKARARLDDPYAQAIPRQGSPNEDHLAFDSADTLAAEGEVVDSQLDDFTTPRFRHD